MASYASGQSRTFVADSDLTDKRYHIAQVTGDNLVDLASSATQDLVGVIEQEGDGAGDSVSVRLRNAKGTFKVIAGGAISIGDKITADASGQAVATTTTGDEVIGVAIKAADAGDIFEFMPVYAIVD